MILNLFQILLFILIIIEFFWGGFTFTIQQKIIPIHQIDIPGIIFLLTIFWNLYKKKPTYILNVLNKIWNKLENIGKNKNSLLYITLVFIIIFTIVHSFKHLSFHTHGYDMAFVNQSLFKMFRPKLLSCDICLNNTYFGEHISWGFLLFAPIAILKSNYALFLVQSFLILFPIFIFLNSKKISPPRIYSLMIFLIILSSRSLRNSLIWDLREDDLTFFFLCLMLLSYYNRKIYFFLVFLLGALLCKENVSLVTFGFGVYTFFDKDLLKKERIFFTTLTIAISLAYLFLTFGYFIPKYTAGHQSEQVILMRFGKYGITPKEVISNMITTPSIWWDLIKNNLFTIDRIKYIFLLLLPFIYFILQDLIILIPISIGLLMNILPNSSTQRMMIFHYDLIILPFCIYALLKMVKKIEERKLKFIFIISLSISGTWPIYYLKTFLPTLNDIANNQFLYNETKNKKTASNLIPLAHLVHLDSIRTFDIEKIDSLEQFNTPRIRGKTTLYGAEIIVLDTTDPNDSSTLKFLSNNKFPIIKLSEDHRFVILKNILYRADAQ